MRRKAIITGGTGFIGRALATHLLSLDWDVVVVTRAAIAGEQSSPGYSTRTVANDNQKVLAESVYDLIASERPDAIFHLAALQLKEHRVSDVADMLMVNVGLGAHLMEAASHFGGVPFVNVGSYWQYFNGQESSPVNLYAATKSALQEISKYYIEVRENPIVNLILVDTYGEGDNRGKILDILIRAAVTGNEIDLSKGEQQLEYIHVLDVIAGLTHAAEGLEGGSISPGTYALGTGVAISLRDMAKIVAEVAGRELAANWGARPYPPRQIMKARIPHPPLPDWQARITLSEGIARLLAAHRIGGIDHGQ